MSNSERIDMSFKDWIFTNYPAHSSVKAWGVGHILTLVGCIGVIIALALCLRKKDEKSRKIVLWILTGLIIFFEVARRIVNLSKNTEWSFTHIMYILLPRPWCAIACWSLIIATIFNKKFLYNFASITALLCAIIFFSYPSVGFKSPYFLFDDLYSVITHCLLLVESITLITLGFTDFKYKQFWKVGICYAVILIYSFLEMYVFKIDADPMYFMPDSIVQDILGMDYNVFLIAYIAFMLFYFNLFPFIQWLTTNKPITKYLNKRKQNINGTKDVKNDKSDVDTKNINDQIEN